MSSAGGSRSPSVLILGGGLAGLAAAQKLAPQGYGVTILEARDRLGGRASSFTDATTGEMIDVCQHVSMGCCTAFAEFCREVGIAHLLQRQSTLIFMTSDGRTSRFRADPCPAPFHLARSFLRAHFLSLKEKAAIASALAELRKPPPADDPPFLDWLAQQKQPQTAIDRFWNLVLTSALNESVERVGFRYARKVFVDAFLSDRRGFELDLPTVPLGRLYGDELRDWLQRHGVQLRLGTGVRTLHFESERVTAVETRSGERLTADFIISALPFDRLLQVLPTNVTESDPYFSNLRRLEFSPITSVHLWYDRPITPQPNLVLVDCVGQWLFNRGETTPGSHYVQVVVSAARQFRGLGHEEIQRRIIAELAALLPEAMTATLQRARVVTDQTATFSAVPGVDQWRPGQQSPFGNLLIAGDWTLTGWPATMESAVRSGWLAAELFVCY